MSDIDVDGETGGGEDGGRRKLSGKFLVLYIILPVLVLAFIGYGAYSFVFPGSEGASTTVDGAPAAQVELTEMGDPVFFDLPEFLVNLSSPDGGPTRYLKLRVSLQLPDEDAVSKLETVMPRVVDGFQVYLRELRPDDFQGSSNMFLLREELLRRVNLAARPVRVNDVLFREVIVQ